MSNADPRSSEKVYQEIPTDTRGKGGRYVSGLAWTWQRLLSRGLARRA